MSHQPDDASKPVAWDPCRPIHYVVNPAGAPVDGAGLIQRAVARVETATGLQFVFDGTTDEVPSKERAAYEPQRYNRKRWAPVLVAWSNERQTHSLAGYIAGLGGPTAESVDGRRYVDVSGAVTLDAEDLSPAKMPDRGVAESVVLHEFGLLVGLDHTADRREIMFSEAEFNVRDYGPGDLRRLALLGTQPCNRGL